MSNPQTPFLDLFQMLRDAGMSLSPEQYDLLRQALGLGYGLGGWDDLRRICRILWVKPSAGNSDELFDRTFNRYIEQYRDTVPVASPPTPPPQPEPTPPLGELPRIPPRMPVRQEQGKVQAPVAVRTTPPKLPPTDTKAFQLTPTDIPVSLEAVQTAWRALRRRVRVGHQYEPDVEATMAQIEREGLFSDIVLRPVLTRAAELLLLVDDSNATIPFRPAFEPFIAAIESGRIHPAQIYRFTSYPTDCLYHWQNPAQAEALASLLPRLHPNRTIALILSDTGAATATYSQKRIEQTAVFLNQLTPCVRQVIWVNPLPRKRWIGTSAEAIALELKGGMISLEPARLQMAARDSLANRTYANSRLNRYG